MASKLSFQAFLNTKTAHELINGNVVTSPCAIGPSNGCGACPLSSINYKTQLALKKQYLLWVLPYLYQQALNKPKVLNRVSPSQLNQNYTHLKEWFANAQVVPSPKTDHYRNKMEYTIGFNGNIGLREKGKWWRVLHNHTCFLAGPQIESTFFKAVSLIPQFVDKYNWTYYDRKKHKGLLRNLIIRQNKSGQVMAGLVISDPDVSKFEVTASLQDIRQQAITLFKSLEVDSGYIVTTQSIADVSFGTAHHVLGQELLYEEFNIPEILGLDKASVFPNKVNKGIIELGFGIDTFFQTNMYLHDHYLETVYMLTQKALNLSTSKFSFTTIYDLYGGIGFFAQFLAKTDLLSNFRFTIVENNASSTLLGKKLATLNGLNNVSFVTQPVEEFIQRTSLSNGVVIVDPARSGLHPKVLKAIISNPPQSLIYVSCNPKRFAEEFIEYLGTVYSIKHAHFLDNFPHTHHVEGFFLLIKN